MIYEDTPAMHESFAYAIDNLRRMQTLFPLNSDVFMCLQDAVTEVLLAYREYCDGLQDAAGAGGKKGKG